MSDQPDRTERVPLFNAVFVISLVFVVGIGAWGLVDPDSMTGSFLGFTNYLLNGISWYWLLITTGFVLLSIYMAFGPYGDVRLGRDDERPEFGTASWIAMLFAGGMGAGLLFWAAAEPIYHFRDPPGMEGGTPAAAREAFVITNLHWGLHAWSIYGMCALVIAYFTFRRGQSSEISTPVLALFKGPAARPIGGRGQRARRARGGVRPRGVAHDGHASGARRALGRLRARGQHEARAHHPRRAVRVLHALGHHRRRQGHQDPQQPQHGHRDRPDAVRDRHGPHALHPGDLRQLGGRVLRPAARDGLQDVPLRGADRLDLGLDAHLPHLVARLGAVRGHLHRAHLAGAHHPGVRARRDPGAHDVLDPVVRGLRRHRHLHRDVRRRRADGADLRRRHLGAVQLPRLLPLWRGCWAARPAC